MMLLIVLRGLFLRMKGCWKIWVLLVPFQHRMIIGSQGPLCLSSLGVL